MPQPQMTVLEILNRTKVFFEKKGIPDARLDAEYIISYGLKMKNRMDLYLNFEKPLTPAELDVLRTMVARRATREPLQHIIGDTSFRGFIIKCDRRALIPRPETESLVDMAADSLKGIENPFIVEIGTGTGAISIACAKEIKGARVLATDVSEDALALARTNAEANGLAGNPDAAGSADTPTDSQTAASTLTFAQGDLLNAVTADVIAKVAGDTSAKIDGLIANLPYIPDSEKDKLQPEVAKYDPALALFGGADGLDLVRKLLQQTEGKLKPGASILLEIGSEQGEMLKAEAEKYPWLEFTGIHKDFCNNIRFVSYKAK
ncbi:MULTISPECIES: peptide chain release factor N(5)-glutamine methyltransferase [unclassified Fibrobacter]|uniref:peptide chain release factor N(5)-glutamine methyltransferase n=1 Tax=unclassified Fibrobacter TaxID=2634177 RepID=UPI000916C9E0|nr:MULTISPECIES: peptide chain release factor N(5)-glutamine methyltransferase [unclassified Fibrobacter]SHK87735.1 release factor glutamine methyltransferase [Fibrobacter sp. UWB12]SIO43470.1 release factor glutamine methyltransferase [Fibrobacter sp. UWB11]